MKIFKVNEKIEVVCESLKTRNGFKHTATLMIGGRESGNVKICYLNRTWERYEFESVLHKMIENSTSLTADEKEFAKNFVEKYEEKNTMFGAIASIALIGDIIHSGDIKKKNEKNEWKERMLKAGLKGIDIPEDWETLSDEVKEIRLNNVIEALKVAKDKN